MFYIGFLLVVVFTTEVLTLLQGTDTLPLLTFSLPLLHLRNNVAMLHSRNTMWLHCPPCNKIAYRLAN
jgi:hypothetical protein